MKTLLIVLMIFSSAIAYSQEDHSCCDLNATKKFSDLSYNSDFRDVHADPVPFDYVDKNGEMITYTTSDGKTANGYLVSSPNKSNKWILVFHEWYGLNDYIKQESDLIREKLGDVNVLALDLYDGQVATNREEAVRLIQTVDQQRAVNIINGAVDYCGEDAEIGTLGWCFGGGWSLNASLLLGSKAKACVIYYGMPSDDIEKLKTLNPPVLGIFAEQDGNITPEIVKQFETNMKEAGKILTVHMYNAAHGFANPSNPKYDPVAREDAMTKTIDFLNENLMN